MVLSTVTLAGKPIGTTGYGLMNFTWRPDPINEEQAFAALKAALERGCNFWNGGELYGTREHNSLHLLRSYFTKYPEDADKVVLSIKGGVKADGGHGIDGSPENVKRSVEFCNGILAGTKKIDVFEVARVDKNTPIETTVKALDELVQAGVIGGIGLSELGAEKIERAAKVAKIAAVEVEVSVFSRDIFHNGVNEVCAKYGIPIVAYSPLSRGLLLYKSTADAGKSIFTQYPRFQGEALEQNMKLVKELQAIAEQKGCTPAQLGINWIKALSQRNGNALIVPIPGTTSKERVVENTTDVELTEEDLSKIQKLCDSIDVVGERYPEQLSNMFDF